MADFFIDPEQPAKPAKQAATRKTKKQQSAEEYEKVCARMAELRARRKGLIKPSDEELALKKEKAERAAAKKLPVKEVVVEKIVEKIVEKPVEKIVEKPVEVIKEVIKEVPAKTRPSLFFEEDIKTELAEIRKLFTDMRPVDASNPTAGLKQPAAKVQPEPVKKEPERFIFTGVNMGFKRIS